MCAAMDLPISGTVGDEVGVEDVSFNDAFERLARLAYRVARRVVSSAGDAEDVAAETLARAQVRWRSVRNHADPWVVTVATRLAVREARRQARRPPPRSRDGSGDGADTVTVRVDLARALGRLSPRQRQAVALGYLGDLGDAEAAEAMGCSVSSYRTHRQRGLVALRSDLADPPGWVRDGEAQVDDVDGGTSSDG